MEKERRWIVLGSDGRHVTLGRHTDPTDDEISDAERGLISQGLSGWLVVVEGSYWIRKSKLTLLMVRPLADPGQPFSSAAAAFEACRNQALETV